MNHAKVRQGKARQGKARQGKARQGKARQGKARQGKARRHLCIIDILEDGVREGVRQVVDEPMGGRAH